MRRIIHKRRTIHKNQYAIIAARRQAYDKLYWQTPPLLVAAQAFLLTIAFDSKTNGCLALLIAIFALGFGVAALQLNLRLRYLEVYDSELLVRYEKAHRTEGFERVHGKRKRLHNVPATGLADIPSALVWSWVFKAFIVLDGIAVLYATSGIAALYVLRAGVVRPDACQL
jgi:hypothetical protein